jgi:hypothetical protein
MADIQQECQKKSVRKGQLGQDIQTGHPDRTSGGQDIRDNIQVRKD